MSLSSFFRVVPIIVAKFLEFVSSYFSSNDKFHDEWPTLRTLSPQLDEIVQYSLQHLYT